MTYFQHTHQGRNGAVICTGGTRSETEMQMDKTQKTENQYLRELNPYIGKEIITEYSDMRSVFKSVCPSERFLMCR